MDKKKLSFIALVCVLLGGLNNVHAQDKLIVNTVDGKDSFPLSEILKLDFKGDQLRIVDLNGSSYRWFAYPYINKLTFDLSGVGIESVVSASELFLYPNPTTEFVQIAGWDANQKETVRIYSTNGQLCYMAKEWNGSPIRVSSLSQGLYILKVNSQTFKFRKL